MKQTAIAPANIAFIKYWGRKDARLRLPANGSISMTLDGCRTTTTVEFNEAYTQDSFELVGEVVTPKEVERTSVHVDRIRKKAGIELYAKVLSQNTFPKGTGIASSASGFAALTVAASKAAGLALSEKELSIIARQGSGSACRSIPDGITEWIEGDSNDTSYAHSLYSADYWDLVNVLAVVEHDEKKVSSSSGHESASSSIFYEPRRREIPHLLSSMKDALQKKDFVALGELLEKDNTYMHAVMMSSTPPIYYWTAGTMAVIQAVVALREQGIPAYCTIDAGPNVHVICEGAHAATVKKQLAELACVHSIIFNRPAQGARITDEHLF